MNFGQSKEQDEILFRSLFADYYQALTLFAVRYVDKQEIAEDIVQDIFAKMWETRKELNHIERISAYLYQMVRFRCFNHLRAEKIRDEAAQNIIAETDISEVNKYIEEESFRLLLKAIEELPNACKNIILQSLQGYSAKEIAENMSIAVETVKKQKQIGKRLLREKLGKLFIYFIAYYNFI